MVTHGSLYDYPRYYDIAHSATTEAEGAFYRQVFDDRLNAFQTLLDVGCGSGRVMAELARMGIKCVGIDKNRTSVEYVNEKARRESLDMTAILSDITAPSIAGPYDAAICTGDTIKYIIDKRDLITHLKNVAAILNPGGLYAVDTSLVGPPEKYVGGAGEWTVVEGAVTVNGSFVAYAVDRTAKTERIRHQLRVVDGTDEYVLTEDAIFHALTFYDYEGIVEESRVFNIECCVGGDYNPANIITPDDETGDVVVLLRKI
ncbi:MAG: methyltransferase domain-containing protein [Candidatus Coatesbacteria bacterium]|nr:MAG: methyltransferase domain-containing protein [Candidatus Coatesbacteria bacterium]